jgi:O-antigen/teichoic acid export membrane protein
MSFLVVRSDIFLVKYFLSNESAGYYSSAVQITDQIQFFGVVVASLLMPKLSAEKDPWERFRLNKRSFNHLLVIMTLGCLAAFVLAKYLVLLLFGGEILPTILPFRVLLPAIFFLALETSLAQYLASIGLPMKLAWAWIITFAINVGLNFYLIPEYGEVGAAISSVVSYCFIFVYVLYLVNTHGRKIRKGLV